MKPGKALTCVTLTLCTEKTIVSLFHGCEEKKIDLIFKGIWVVFIPDTLIVMRHF